MTSDLSIQQAAYQDLATVVEILDEAAAWLKEKGIDQWPASFSGDDTWRTDRIRSYLEHGNTYLVYSAEGIPIATFTLTRGADPQFAHGWPEGPDVGGYIFRIAVRRYAAGNNVGARILDWAANEVGRWGRKWLRLDVHRHNADLQRYYKRQGFVKVAEVTAPDLSVPGRIRGSGTLMQRRIVNGNGGHGMDSQHWDPDGTAAALLEAAHIVLDLRLEVPAPPIDNAWNVALEQAARVLNRHALDIRKANGMWPVEDHTPGTVR